MFVICFIPNRLAGGYGDRIVGLIAIKLISKLLHRPFYILWNKENIKEFINYRVFDFEKTNIPLDQIKFYDYIDNQTVLKDYLQNTNVNHIFSSNEISGFLLNQEIAQYLYKNPEFSKENYYNDILLEYKKLYTHTLKPTPALLSKINELTASRVNIIGIQLRCGDFYMETNKGESYNTGIANKLDVIFNKIKQHCDLNYKDDYNIFLTSDYSGVYDKGVEIWNKERIIYNHDLIQHLDRQSISDDISKVFIDNYILSQKTTILFITEYSNYGRIAGLSAIHDNIYDLDCCRLNLKKLFSKHENYQ